MNEEGPLRYLPFNARATFTWCYHVPNARNRAMLVGNVVMVGMPDEDGESTDVPADVVRLLMNPGEFVVAARFEPSIPSAIEHFGVVLPIASGDTNWFVMKARYEDYGSAAVWVMVLAERLSKIVETKVLPEVELPRARPLLR